MARRRVVLRKIGAIGVLRALMALTLLVEPLQAQSAPAVPEESAISKECQTPGVKLALDKPLPNTLAALKERKVIKILTIGASASAGMDPSSGGYQDIIEDTLERTVPGLDVQIIDRGVSGELASNAAQRLKTEIALTEPDLDRLEADLYPNHRTDVAIEHILHVLQSDDATKLDSELSTLYQQQGMETFIMQTVIPLLRAVGERWAMGRLQIFEEHLLSEVLTRLLNSKIYQLQKTAKKPRVLLATLPGEEHTLGLLMVSALISSKNISVVNLGAEVPLDQIISAVDRYEADILGVTFSGAYQYENIRSDINELRDLIPEGVDIWIGGEAVKRMRKLPLGVTKFTSMDKLPF